MVEGRGLACQVPAVPVTNEGDGKEFMFLSLGVWLKLA